MKEDEIILKIISKKELQGIPFSFVKEKLSLLISKRKINLELLSYKDEAILVKEIRSALREYVGRFSKSSKKRGEYLLQGKYEELLKTHSSTKERLFIYPWLKEKITELNPHSILDLACGINPIALANTNIFYYACDLNNHDLISVEEYFKRENIKGKIFECNLASITTLPYADLTIILKTLDILEKKHRGVSEKILSAISSKKIIVSFSAVTLSGKPMNFPKRKWFENILNKKKMHFSIEKKHNEIFYFIKNQSS